MDDDLMSFITGLREKIFEISSNLEKTLEKEQPNLEIFVVNGYDTWDNEYDILGVYIKEKDANARMEELLAGRTSESDVVYRLYKETPASLKSKFSDSAQRMIYFLLYNKMKKEDE